MQVRQRVASSYRLPHTVHLRERPPWTRTRCPAILNRMPTPIRHSAMRVANKLAKTGATPREALRRGIVRAWATETTESTSHYDPERPPGRARFLIPDGAVWRMQTLGRDKVVSCANFAWAIRRGSAACERDNGAIFAQLPDSRGLVSFSGLASLKPSDVWVRPLRKDTWAVAHLDMGASVFERFDDLEAAQERAIALAETLERPAWQWAPKAKTREQLSA